MPSITIGASTLIGGALSAGSSIFAGQKQSDAANHAGEQQMQMFERTQQNMQPYMNAGLGGIQGVNELLGIGGPGQGGGSAGQPDSAATLGQIKQGLQAWSAAKPGNAEPIIQMIDKGAPLSAVQQALTSLRATTTHPSNTAFLDPLISQAKNPVMGQGQASGSGVLNSDTIMNRLEKTPGYQFAKQQGLQATQNSFAAQGLGQSGAALKGAASFATGLADQTYQSQFDNFFKLMSSGQSAAAGMGQLGQGAATQAGQFSTSGAAAQGAGAVGAANSLGGGLTGMAATRQLGMFGGSGEAVGQFGSGQTNGPSAYGGPQGFVKSGTWSPYGYAY